MKSMAFGNFYSKPLMYWRFTKLVSSKKQVVEKWWKYQSPAPFYISFTILSTVPNMTHYS